jgi:hypothetical protein
MKQKDTPYLLYDYVDENKKNDIKRWAENLQKDQRAKLNARLDMLRLLGPDLFPQVLTGTPTPGILKLRIKGNVQLRPCLCRGPIGASKQFTLLIGATERDSKLVPDHADQIANQRREIIILNPNRRRSHERVS